MRKTFLNKVKTIDFEHGDEAVLIHTLEYCRVLEVPWHPHLPPLEGSPHRHEENARAFLESEENAENSAREQA